GYQMDLTDNLFKSLRNIESLSILQKNVPVLFKVFKSLNDHVLSLGNLKELDIPLGHLDDNENDAKLILKILADNLHNIQHLRLRFHYSAFYLFKNLDYFYNKLSSSKVESLSIQSKGVKISDETIKILAKNYKNLKSLEYSFDHRCFDKVRLLLSNLNSSKIEKLKISLPFSSPGQIDWVYFAENIRNVKELSITDCHITLEDLETLLQIHPRLYLLDLSSAFLHVQDSVRFAEAINQTSIKHLTLKNNQLNVNEVEERLKGKVTLTINKQ
ncbi:hypothetical protein ROZALSC1DRAFT_22073, partial [Rozella allomycis CSF55]